MATIQDVAKRAGVSVATVSRHLSGQQVRAAAAVERAVAELAYRPNASARSLKTGRRGAVGVIVPDISNPFFAAVVKGLERAIPDSSIRMLLANSEESAEIEAELLADLVDRVDGFVLAPANEEDSAPLQLAQRGLPVVLLDRKVADTDPHDVVLVDNVGGAASAARHLLELGHRRIAMINGPANTTPGRERRAGFLAALEEAGVSTLPEHDLLGDFKEASGHDLAHQLMSLPTPPTALFTANNQMTVGALHALQELGIDVPRQLSLIGFDDLRLGSLLRPPLTCVARDEVRQGELVMTLLLRRLHGDVDGPARQEVLPTELIVRGSTAAPAGDSDDSNREEA